MELTHSYDSLPLPMITEAPQIRLLTLLKGTASDQLDISLSIAPLTGPDIPVFEALSYAWGTLEKFSEVTVRVMTSDPENFTFRLAVTENLYSALWHLRFTDRDRVLWVDAICIDQSNTEERSSQVSNMANVYRLASQVIVWLGPESDNSKLAIRRLRELSSRVVVNWVTFAFTSSSSGEPHWADTMKKLPYNDEELCAIEDLFSRDWFLRLWVIQEVHFAQNAVVCCGHDSLPWRAVIESVFCFQNKFSIRDLVLQNTGQQPFLQSFMSVHNPELKISLTELLHMASVFRCSDDRDRVYALPPLAGASLAELRLNPDYTATTMEVYRDFVLKCIKFYREMDIIVLLSSTGSDCTWVPSFHMQTRTSYLEPEMASGSLTADCEYLGSNILRVKGVHCDTIQDIKTANIEGNSIDAIRRSILRLAPQDLLSKPYVTGCSAMLAFAATLMCHRGVEYEPPTANQWTAGEVEAWMSEFLHYSPESNNKISRGMLNLASRLYGTCDGRALATTRDGYFALVPENTQQNDSICCLFGLQNLVVLRKTTEGNERNFEIVGPAFVHGLNFGESIFGPLKDSWRIALVLDEEDGGYKWNYLNNETGEKRSQDPRLDSLQYESIGAAGGLWSKVVIEYDDLEKLNVTVEDFLLV